MAVAVNVGVAVAVGVYVAVAVDVAVGVAVYVGVPSMGAGAPAVRVGAPPASTATTSARSMIVVASAAACRGVSTMCVSMRRIIRRNAMQSIRMHCKNVTNFRDSTPHGSFALCAGSGYNCVSRMIATPSTKTTAKFISGAPAAHPDNRTLRAERCPLSRQETLPCATR